MNSCFEDLEGRVGLKRVWEFVPKVGEKNKRMKVSSDCWFGSFTRRGLLAELEMACRNMGDISQTQQGGSRPERRR